MIFRTAEALIRGWFERDYKCAFENEWRLSGFGRFPVSKRKPSCMCLIVSHIDRPAFPKKDRPVRQASACLIWHRSDTPDDMARKWENMKATLRRFIEAGHPDDRGEANVGT